MPRMQTRGPAISYRLPQHLHDQLVDAVGSTDLSLGQLTERIVRNWLIERAEPTIPHVDLTGHPEDATVATDLDELEPPATCITDAVAVTCPHTRSKPIAAGLRRCNDCGAVRDANGTWRHP